MQDDSAPPTPPRLIDIYEVRRQLRLREYELQRLLEIGIVVPVGRCGEYPLFDPDAIERLKS